MLQLNDWIFQHHTATAWLCYCLLCIPSVYFILWLLPNRLARTYALNFIFFLVLSLSIFLFGVVISLVLSLALHYIHPPKKEKILMQLADFPEYQRAPKAEQQVVGEGYGYKTVRDKNLPKHARERMLVALNQFDSSCVNQINKSVLNDEVDEIRLYAQSLIEKQERSITQTIKHYANLIAKTTEPSVIAFYQKQIAHAWWEEVYRRLINEENIPSILDKVEFYANSAFEVLTDDIDLPLLLARAALKRGHLDEAKKWLAIAKKNHAPTYKTELFLAEILYLEKDYTAIRQLLSNLTNSGLIGSQPVISFWTSYD